MANNFTPRTKSFLRAIQKAAMEECTDISSQIEENSAHEMQRAEDEARRAGHAKINAAKAKILANSQSEIAKYNAKRLGELYAKRNRCREDVFASAKQKLIAFAHGEEYPDFLNRSLKRAKEITDGEITVFVSENESNENLILSVFPECKIIKTGEIEIGGIKILNEKAGIMLDDTVDARLEEQKGLFALNSGLEIKY